MKKAIQLASNIVFWIFILLIASCKKDTLSVYETAVVNMKIFDDDSIALPVAITAGNNCLLSAYSVTSGELKFNLTDNDGNLIWQKQFGVNSIRAILKENDGTFTIFSGSQFINIDLQGNILKNTHLTTFYPSFFDNSTIFSTQINKNNNYIICGVYGIGLNSVNRAFAAELTHNGDSVFFRRLLDTVTTFNVIGNYSAITGCEETDDGGYLFLGSYWGYYYAGFSDGINFNIIKTNNLGEVIWQRNHLLVDSAHVPLKYYESPLNNQLPYSSDIYGFHSQSYTHEIMRTTDGNYLCFLNTPDYLSDQRARVYKIDQNGNMLDSVFIDFGKYNRYMGGLANYYKVSPTNISYSCGNGVVRNTDNTFSICMQDGFFGSKGLTTSYIGESKSFVVRIDENLNILNTHYLQNYYSDCFTSNCKSSDGRTVYFGLISSFGKSYKPALIFSNDN